MARQYTQRGLADLRGGRTSEAEQQFLEAIQVCPQDPMSRKLYADALWSRGAQAEAIEQARECIRLSGALDVGQIVRLGEMYLQGGDLPHADEQAQSAVRLANSDPAGWILRAHVRTAQGKHEMALADLQRALSHDPDNLAVRLEIVELYHQLQRPDHGLAVLHALMETTPEADLPARVALLEGLALQQQGRHHEAIEAFDRAQRRGTPPAELWPRAHESYLALGMRNADPLGTPLAEPTRRGPGTSATAPARMAAQGAPTPAMQSR